MGGMPDGSIKICHDILQNVVYKDDNQVKKVMIELFEPCNKDQIIVKVYKLSEKELKHIEDKKNN